jgi:hypothetical protein
MMGRGVKRLKDPEENNGIFLRFNEKREFLLRVIREQPLVRQSFKNINFFSSERLSIR